MRRRTTITAAVFIVALVVVGLVLSNSSAPPATEGGNLLTNGGFETGNLRGWETGGLLLPSVESTVVQNGTYAVRFATTSNDDALSQCTLHALQCALLNSSTISQTVSSISISPDTQLSLALYPMFRSPSTFQMTLDFATSSQQNSKEITIYYIFYASSEQCDAYSQLLVNGSQYARAFCLSAPHGEWSAITRSLSNDLPAAVSLSTLRGSALTISLSFAGGNSTDAAYVDSVSLI